MTRGTRHFRVARHFWDTLYILSSWPCLSKKKNVTHVRLPTWTKRFTKYAHPLYASNSSKIEEKRSKIEDHATCQNSVDRKGNFIRRRKARLWLLYSALPRRQLRPPDGRCNLIATTVRRSLKDGTEPQAWITLEVWHRCRNERVEQNLPEITQALINPCSRFCERRRRESRRINARVCDSRTLSPRPNEIIVGG
nr:uncharacterized protein LOC117221519 [Megalopta genalis]